MALELQITQREGVAVLVCNGRIVFGEETTRFCRTVRNLLPQCRNIVLNLAEVRYIDSGGLGALVGLLLSARRMGGDIKISNLAPRVSYVLHVTRLDGVIDVFPDEQMAAAAFRPRAAAAIA